MSDLYRIQNTDELERRRQGLIERAGLLETKPWLAMQEAPQLIAEAKSLADDMMEAIVAKDHALETAAQALEMVPVDNG